MKPIREIAKRMPGLRRVVGELRALRADNHNLRVTNQALQAQVNDLTEKMSAARYRPDADDLQVKCFEFWQMAGLKRAPKQPT